jgi:hypothetical protein
MGGAHTLSALDDRKSAQSAEPDPRQEPECCPVRGKTPVPRQQPSTRDLTRPPQRSLGLTLTQVFARQYGQATSKSDPLHEAPSGSSQSGLPSLHDSVSVEFEGGLTEELDPLPFVVDEEFWLSANSIDRPADEGTDDQYSASDCLVQWQERDHRQRSARRSINAQSLPFVQSSLRDLNMSGLALLALEPIAPGTVLDLQIITTEGGVVVETGATIVRCETSKSRGFQIICRLHRYLTYTEIREIGQSLFTRAIV